MAFPLLAVLAELALQGYKGYQVKRAQDQAEKRRGSAALANLSQNLSGEPMQPRIGLQGGDPLASTNLDDQMERMLFNQIFRDILNPKQTAGGA